jgi:hypothetical protein
VRTLKQSTARAAMIFMTDEDDGRTGLTGLTLTCTLSKAGAAFASISPTVTERGNGWYSVTFTTSHTDTIGDLVLRATATGADSAEVAMQVVQATPTQVVTGRYDDPGANYPTITCIVGELGVTKSVTVTDASEVAVDLTDWGDKVLVIERTKPRADIQVVENADITVSGDDNEVFTFQPSSTVLAKPADYIWSLRESSSGHVITQGRLAVSYAALEDVP